MAFEFLVTCGGIRGITIHLVIYLCELKVASFVENYITRVNGLGISSAVIIAPLYTRINHQAKHLTVFLHLIIE